MRDAARIEAALCDRVAHLISPSLSAALVDKLLTESRFRARLIDVAIDRLGLIESFTDDQAFILAMAPDALEALALRAGAVWRARAMARIITGVARRALNEGLGEDAVRLALDGLHLAPPDESVDLSAEAIVADVPIAGAACLAAWCASQPPPVAKRVDLLRPSGAPNEKYRARGPTIVDWVIGRR